MIAADYALDRFMADSARQRVAEESRKARKKFAGHAKIAAIGFGAGFLTKITFVAAATLITVPTAGTAIATTAAAALLAGAISNVARTYVASRIKKEKLQKGWWKSAVIRGFLTGAVGGVFGAVAAEILPMHDILDFARNHLGFTHHAPATLMLGKPVTPMDIRIPGLDTQNLAATVPDPIINIEPPLDLAHFTQTDEFHHLPLRIQNLANAALKSGNPKNMMGFYKEASFQLINGTGHSMVTEQLGQQMVHHAADIARADNLSDPYSKMILRDDAYLNNLHAPTVVEQHAAVRMYKPYVVPEYWVLPNTGLPPVFGDIPNPITGRISSGFGYRFDPHSLLPKMHEGVDFLAPMGTPVHAVVDGTIVEAGYESGYGNVIRINHDGAFTTLYGHLRSFANNLRPGMYVGQGDVIGTVGMTGNATGPNLHLGWFKNNRWVDPLREWVGRKQLAQQLFSRPRNG